MSNTDDDRFVEKAKSLFDQSADGLDGATRSRLNQGRQEALTELQSRATRFGQWTRWVPAGAVAAVAAVAVVLWNGNPEVDSLATAAISDFEILLDDDSFEMLQELEFYSWLDIEAEFERDEDLGRNVG